VEPTRWETKAEARSQKRDYQLKIRKGVRPFRMAARAWVFVFILAWASLRPGPRAQVVLLYAIAAVSLLLVAKYIVYSFNREKSQLRGPYHPDHIIK
jgi:hypothetical protein